MGIWQMNAFNGAVESGAEGATLFAPWSQVNPASGQYSWGSLDRQIAMHVEAGRPVGIMVTVSRTGAAPTLCIDDTPPWVAASLAVPVQGGRLQLPAYQSAAWQAALRGMIVALGQHYAADNRVSHVVIGIGLDGESQAYRSDYEASVQSALGSDYRAAFEKYALASLSWYRKALPSKPLYAAVNPGGQGLRKQLIRKMLDLGIGYKNCGLAPDWPTAWSYNDCMYVGGNYGLWAPMRDLRGRLPIWLESVSGVVNAESVYWSLLLGLSWKPCGIDLHREWFAANPEQICWANAYLNEPDRGAWIVLRDAEYGPYATGVGSTSAYYLSGWPGDLEYGIIRASTAPVLRRNELPTESWEQPESRQARKLAGAMQFTVAHPETLGEQLEIHLSALSEGTLEVQPWGYRPSPKEVGRRFEHYCWKQSVPLDWDGRVSIQGYGALHKLEILRASAETQAPPALHSVPDGAERIAIRDMAGAQLGAVAIEAGDWNDELLAEAGELGAPLTGPFAYAGFACRGFCHGIATRCMTDGTRSRISWGGELL